MDYLSVTQVLGFFTDTRWYTEESRVRGNSVHDFCNLLVTKNITLQDATKKYCNDNVPYKSFYQSFIKWSEVCDPLPLVAEERFADKKLGLTGKPDFIGTINGKKGLGIIDFKTSSHSYPQWDFQIAAYVYLATISGLKIDWGATLSIQENGTASRLKYTFAFNSVENKYLAALQGTFFSLLNISKTNGWA